MNKLGAPDRLLRARDRGEQPHLRSCQPCVLHAALPRTSGNACRLLEGGSEVGKAAISPESNTHVGFLFPTAAHAPPARPAPSQSNASTRWGVAGAAGAAGAGATLAAAAAAGAVAGPAAGAAEGVVGSRPPASPRPLSPVARRCWWSCGQRRPSIQPCRMQVCSSCWRCHCSRSGVACCTSALCNMVRRMRC